MLEETDMDIVDRIERFLGIGPVEQIIPGPGPILRKVGAPTPEEILPTPERVADDILPRP